MLRPSLNDVCSQSHLSHCLSTFPVIESSKAMGVVAESFSIRDYVGRMRGVDLRGSSPFDSRWDDEQRLPPISVRKFRWWEDELECARSAMVVEAECQSGKAVPAALADDIPSVPRILTEAVAAPPAAEEERRPSRGKQRTPKKRSILELFAAAPPIEVNEMVDADSDDGEPLAEEAKSAGNGEGVLEEEQKIMLAVPMRKRKGIKENNVKRKKGRKKKGIKEGLDVEICAWEKEKICKHKLLSSVQSLMVQNPICSKKFRKTATSLVESQKKKPTKLKTVRKKHKALLTAKLLPRNHELPKKLPLRSILKNQKKGLTTKKSSKITSARAANLIKLYCKSKRHVTFSVKDDILGHRKACSSMDFPQLQNLCKIFSDVLAASSAIYHSSKGHDLVDANGRPLVVNSSEKESRVDVIEKTEASTSGKNHLNESDVNVCQPAIVNSSNSSCSGTEKASSAVMVDLNHAIETPNDLDCFIPDTVIVSPSCIYSNDPTCRSSVHTKKINSASEIRLEAGMPRASVACLLPKPHDKFVSSSNATSSLAIMKNLSSHSSTPCPTVNNETNEMQFQTHVGADVSFFREREEHQSGSNSTPKGLLSSICYSIGSKRFEESVFTRGSVSTCKSKCMGKDFIGLPLNSQGELIQFSSGTKFPEKYNRKNIELGSSHGFSARKQSESSGRANYLEIMKKKVAAAASHQKNQFDLRQKQNNTRERVRHWLNFSELESSERLEHQKNENLEDKDMFLHSNSNQTTGSFHEYRNHNVTHEFLDRLHLQGKCNADNHVQPADQPMMRLMGKNVVVGGANKECNGFDDGKIWRNKETSSEQTQFPTMPENPLSKQWMQTDSAMQATNGISEGNLLELSDSTPNFGHMTALESTFDYMSITQPQWLGKNNVPSAIGNHNIMLDLNKHALPPHAFLNKATQFLGNCVSGEGSVAIGHHWPSILPSQPQNVHRNMLLSSIHHKNSQRTPFGASSATHPQFGYQNFQNLGHPPFIQPTEKLPQWLLHANQQKRNQLSDSHYSNPTVFNQPCGVPGNNLNSHLSPYHVCMLPFSVQNNDPRKSCSSFAPNACTPSYAPNACRPSYAPVVTAAKPNSEFKNLSIKKKDRSVINQKFSCYKGPADPHKPKKRPAISDNGLMNPAKRPSLKRQPDSNVAAGVRRTAQMNSYAALDKAISLDFQQTANGKGAYRNATDPSSSNFDSDSRPGPTKLMAGAKHILKPCQRMDDERCRATHSTLIFHNNAAVGKFQSSEKKIANIYKF